MASSNFPYVYLPHHLAAERELAALLIRLANTQVEPVPGWESYTDGLDRSQIYALESSMRNAFTMIYGMPGTGKTKLSKTIIQCFDNAGMSGMVMAPTGKATKRAKEVMWEIHDKLNHVPPCKTTYRGLEWNPQRGGFLRNFRNPFDVDYIIGDEWGFVGLMHSRDFLLAVNPKRTRLIVIGDPFQLPSVEAGSIYRDMINSKRFAAAELTEIHRTGANSGIAVNAALILRGESPVKTDPCTGEKFKDWKFIVSDSEDGTHDLMKKLIPEDIPKFYGVDAVNDIQLISPGKKSKIGTVKLNDTLRDILNPGKPRFRGFRMNDKVINRRTSYPLEICNGDVGRIVDIGDRGLTINFGAGTGPNDLGIVQLEGEQADNIHLNYAQTVHSSQGSEMPVAVIPLHRCHWRLLSRNLLFTAQTRARQGAIIVGDPEAMQQCIKHSETLSRTTGLNHWLENHA